MTIKIKKKNQLGALSMLWVASLTLSACSTITRGTEEVLVINSEPSNAKVTLSNGMLIMK